MCKLIDVMSVQSLFIVLQDDIMTYSVVCYIEYYP